MPHEHELKTWPAPFEAVMRLEKLHEIRKTDRPFMVGDVLRLREWDPIAGSYTGREVRADVTHLTPPGDWGLPPGLCVMSIRQTSVTPGRFAPPAPPAASTSP